METMKRIGTLYRHIVKKSHLRGCVFCENYI